MSIFTLLRLPREGLPSLPLSPPAESGRRRTGAAGLTTWLKRVPAAPVTPESCEPCSAGWEARWGLRPLPRLPLSLP